jgi:uncharacterized protein (TIGR03435 family)
MRLWFGLVLAFIIGSQSLAAQGAAAFDVASIRPSSPDNPKFVADLLPGGRFVGRNISTKLLMNVAFGPKGSLILGAPNWFDDHYDIDAKTEGAGEMTEAQAAIPILALLRDRFGLVTHEETIQQNVYFLQQRKSGAKLTPSAPETEYSFKRTADGVFMKGETMAHFAPTFGSRPDVQAPVIDNTGLPGKFDFFFPYIHGSEGVDTAGPAPDVTPEVAKRLEAAYSSTFAALQSIGLELKPGKRAAIAVVIDQIHRPTAN